jgi:hypothetical protein
VLIWLSSGQSIVESGFIWICVARV